ncbi:MAG: response regulator [Spirochaetia bacterium]
MAKQILVVDDSAAIRKSITFVLEQEGYEVVNAEDGSEGFDKSEEKKYDLIVTDVNMPNKDGITMVKDIRGSQKNKFTPIIVLTTESQSSKMDEGKAAGATGWIVKPFSAEKLLAVVKKILGE